MNKLKYVSPLTEKHRHALKALMKRDHSMRARMRAHCILLSADHFTLNEISRIYEIDRDTVSIWIDKWERYGIVGLKDKKRVRIRPEKQKFCDQTTKRNHDSNFFSQISAKNR
jgi:hypothetical protein